MMTFQTDLENPHNLSSKSPLFALARGWSPPSASGDSNLKDQAVGELRRAAFRDRIFTQLEEDDGIDEHIVEVQSIVDSGRFHLGTLAQLRAIPISKQLLEQTQVGKFLSQHKEAIGPAASDLLDYWKSEVARHIKIAYELENAVFEKHIDDGLGTKNIANSGWKYAQEVRSVLQLLRKEWNAKIKGALISGALSPRDFWDQYCADPDVFSSPARQVAKLEKEKQDALELDGFQLEDDFPFFDKDLVCPSCKVNSGARYSVIHMDTWSSYRGGEDERRRIMCKCADCSLQWTVDEN
jgi:hypothetical protein